jgi:hypothetical protein
MWALDVSFSTVYMKLLVPQDSTFSVQVLRVFRLQGSSLSFLESCLLHCLTRTGLRGLVNGA